MTDYDDTDEMEDEYEPGTPMYYGDDDYDDEPDDENYEYEVYTPVFTWRDRPRLLLLDWRNFRWQWRQRLYRWRAIGMDPAALFRRCKVCGNRGCVSGTEVCWNDSIPF